jgi:hypothetical protein
MLVIETLMRREGAHYSQGPAGSKFCRNNTRSGPERDQIDERRPESGLIAWMHPFRGDDRVKGRRPPSAAAFQAALDTIVSPKKQQPSDHGRELIRV